MIVERKMGARVCERAVQRARVDNSRQARQCGQQTVREQCSPPAERALISPLLPYPPTPLHSLPYSPASCSILRTKASTSPRYTRKLHCPSSKAKWDPSLVTRMGS
jgi:hypothetical protein